MASRDEQETTVTWAMWSDIVTIYTAVPKHLRKLRAEGRVTEVRGGEDWGEFEVSSKTFDALNGFKRNRKPLSPEQRDAAATRLANVRKNKN